MDLYLALHKYSPPGSMLVRITFVCIYTVQNYTLSKLYIQCKFQIISQLTPQSRICTGNVTFMKHDTSGYNKHFPGYRATHEQLNDNKFYV